MGLVPAFYIHLSVLYTPCRSFLPVPAWQLWVHLYRIWIEFWIGRIFGQLEQLELCQLAANDL
jgi:hypothetical protein